MAPPRWKSSLLCCVGGIGAAVRGADDDTPSSPRSPGTRTRKTDRDLLPPSSSASRVSISSLGSTSGTTLTPDDLSATLSLGSTSRLLHAFTHTVLRAATGGFSRANRLGCGGFGPVYRGRVDAGLRPGLEKQDVAVKCLDRDSSGAQGHREWLAEVVFLGQLRHEHLVRLVGYCCEDEHRMVVYEYLANGSLEKHLFESHDGPMPWMTRMKIAVGAAKGLAFLHDGADTPVIHRDFKASNILLDADYNAKLSDFGLAKGGPQGDATHITTRIMGTNGYAAPEYIMTGHLTTKSDVYGFGVVLMELLSGRRSVDLTRRLREQSLVDWGRPYLKKPDKLHKVMDQAMEGQYSTQGVERAAMVAYKCLSQNGKARPTMREVVKDLEPILGMHDYLDVGPFVFTFIVKDNNEDNEIKSKMVDGEKVDVRIETTVKEKHQSHQDQHRQKYPNSVVHADVVLHRDGPHMNVLHRHRRTPSYLKERGA